MILMLTKRQLEKVDWENDFFELDHPDDKYAYFDHIYDPEFGEDEWWFLSSAELLSIQDLVDATDWEPIDDLTEEEKKGILKFGKVILK